MVINKAMKVDTSDSDAKGIWCIVATALICDVIKNMDIIDHAMQTKSCRNTLLKRLDLNIFVRLRKCRVLLPLFFQRSRSHIREIVRLLVPNIAI